MKNLNTSTPHSKMVSKGGAQKGEDMAQGFGNGKGKNQTSK